MGKGGSTWLLLGLVGVGLYLVYKSIANVGYSINSQLTGLNGYLSGVGGTLGAEANAIGSSLGNPIGTFASLGTSAGSSISGGLSSLFGGGWQVPDFNTSYYTPNDTGALAGTAAVGMAGGTSYLGDMMVGPGPTLRPDSGLSASPQPGIFDFGASDPALGGGAGSGSFDIFDSPGTYSSDGSLPQ